MRGYYNSNSGGGARSILSKYKVQFLVLFVLFLYFTSFYSYDSSKTNQQQQGNNNNNDNKPHTTKNPTYNNNKQHTTPTPSIHEEFGIPINDASSLDEIHEGGGNMDPIIPSNNLNNKNNADTSTIPPYDIAIIVLGYELHDDGMPTRILKDRVELAADLYGKLRGDGNSPLLVLSGKGKGNPGDEAEYKSEAEAMRDLAVNSFDVDARDIWLDFTSTNTAENAHFTLSMLITKGIARTMVVTSDFHMLRAQYIFQTVFPSDMEITFISVATSEKVRTLMDNNERTLMLSSQKDLEKLDLLKIEGEASFGYHPIRNVPRWKMIERELEADKRAFRTMPGEGDFMADYGSNQGYFSIHLAKKFPKATMMSMEGEKMNEYRNAATQHEEKIIEWGVENNFVCKTQIGINMFQELVQRNHLYEYQLCLSIFHWFPMKTKEEFEAVLLNHLMNAKTTFIELPEPMNYVGKEGQHAWQNVNIWYDGRTESEIFNDIKEKYQLKMEWKILGALIHDNRTVRKVMRVDMKQSPETRSPIAIDQLKEIYQCQNSIQDIKRK